MGNRDDDEDLQMALWMSLHGSPQEPKRSRPVITEEFEEARERRIQREIRAAAAEKRMSVMRKNTASVPMMEDGKGKGVVEVPGAWKLEVATGVTVAGVPKVERKKDTGYANLGVELSAGLTNQLFTMLFGSDLWNTILARWSNQGIRFSSDAETSIGLVQFEGGPCGVLAAIQAFVLKYLIYLPEKLNNTAFGSSQPNLGQRKLLPNPQNELDYHINANEDIKRRALVLSMTEILFSCGGKKRAAVTTLNILGDHSDDGFEDIQKDEILSKALEGFTLTTASELQKMLRVTMYTSESAVFERLMKDLPVFQSRMGATLFLISALLSRGLDSIQADRDDPSLPLVTAPFGHASQEIVNLLLCGHAAPNVFDNNMDLGGGMSLKGIPGNVEVGFLTLLESHNFCKVGQYLKCPRWPIWVVGSESHYTVLFALDSTVQDENVLEARHSLIRGAFNNHDESGGGGFIAVKALNKVLEETNISMLPEKVNDICNAGYVVWNDFWQVLIQLDTGSGGMKDSNAKVVGNKEFKIYHFNGIAKSVANGISGSTLIQRPRLCKLFVSVPPVWTQHEYMADSSTNDKNASEVNQIWSPQYAPLVDCIRTRWPRAVCHWEGDAPSIV